MHSVSKIEFSNQIIMLGCGFIGTGVLPLIFRHIDIKPEQLVVITADDRGKEIADYYGVTFLIRPLNPENCIEILNSVIHPGDFLLNLASDIESYDIIDFCCQNAVLYLDTCIDSWLGESTNIELSVSQRTLYTLREKVLALREKWTPSGPTAVLAHGANPGIVSHLIKKALLNIASDDGKLCNIPKTQEEWALLSQSLDIKVIHIAERDTQIAHLRKMPNEFVNTWSIDGLIGEGLQPAELGWGSHEMYFPHDAGQHHFGSQTAIFIEKPGLAVKIRTWLPIAGPQIGFLITHNESISIANYLSIGTGHHPQYRPTVYYVYHPCDDAILSIHELQENNWLPQERSRAITEDIVSGTDELGVLLMRGHNEVYWYGSRLDIHQARQIAPFNSATSLQVAGGVISGMIWAIHHPNRGIVEAEDMDFAEVLEIAEPYWGGLVGEYNHWNPLMNHCHLFPADIDFTSPWQFKNFRVS